MPPAKHDQVPRDTLNERQEHLVAHRDKRDFPIRVGGLDTRQVALFEAKVGNGREGLPAWSRTDDFAGDRRVGGVQGLRA